MEFMSVLSILEETLIFPYFQLASTSKEQFLEEKPAFSGSKSRFVEKIEFIEPHRHDGIPVYRVMDRKGSIMVPSEDPQVGCK